MLLFRDVLRLGRKKRKPTPIAIRLQSEWADLQEELLVKTGLGPTALLKHGLKTLALLDSVDDTGQPLKVTVHTEDGPVDMKELVHSEKPK